jgi:hypothetical protein
MKLFDIGDTVRRSDAQPDSSFRWPSRLNAPTKIIGKYTWLQAVWVIAYNNGHPPDKKYSENHWYVSEDSMSLVAKGKDVQSTADMAFDFLNSK